MRSNNLSRREVGAAIIGAQKCGTTTLAAMLDEHPMISLAVGKETHLFDQASVQQNGPTDEDLDRFWPDHSPGQMLLDATPSYLYLPGCIEALLRHSPEVRFIVILRPPGDRMVSHHAHERRLGVEHRSPFLAFFLERYRLRRSQDPLDPNSPHRHSSYRDRSCYSRQIRHLKSLTDHVHFVLLNELIADPTSVVEGVHRFLDLHPHPVGTLPRLNAGDGKKRRLSRFVARMVTLREAIATERLLRLPTGSLR